MTPTAHTSLCGCHLARQHSGARYLCVVGKVGGSRLDACALRGLRPAPAGPVAIGRCCESLAPPERQMLQIIAPH